MTEKELLKSEIEKAFVEWFEKGNITYCLNPEAETIWKAAVAWERYRWHQKFVNSFTLTI